MLQWKMHVHDAIFTPPFPDKTAFHSLTDSLGAYQGIFRNNEYLELYSRYQTRIWPSVSHEKTYQDLFFYLEAAIRPDEHNRFQDFREQALTCPEVLTGSFSFLHPVSSDLSQVGIFMRRSPWGMHVIFSPGKDRSVVEHMLSSTGRVCWDSLWQGIAPWFSEEEVERLVCELIRTIPGELARGCVFYRETPSPVGDGSMKTLFYELKKDKWHRSLVEEETLPPSLKTQAYRRKDELILRTNIFVGSVLPLFRIDIPYRNLEVFGLHPFRNFLSDYSIRSVRLASSFTSDIFRFATFWQDETYQMEGLPTIASALSPEDPLSLVVLPIWNVTENALPDIRKATRLSDPLFFDRGKGMGLILLRDCPIENAQSVVYPNLGKKLSCPVDAPLTVQAFLETR